MQIFILHKNPKLSAIMHTDKHIVKQITESCQILSTVYRKYDTNILDLLYKSTHEKHPCVLWANTSIQNYLYLLELSQELYNEYQYRYNKPEKHQRANKIIEYLKKHLPRINNYELTPFAQAMPDKYRNKDTVTAYRDYYINEKKHLFKWTKRNKPEWIP